MLTCSYCSYSSNRVYNLNRHLKIHQNSIEPIENTIIYDPEIIEETAPKSVKTAPKSVKMEPKSVKMEPKSVKMEPKSVKHKCSGCYKEFCYHKTMMKHLAVCKKIEDPCECPNCHVVFENKQAVYNHKRRDNCTSTALIPIENTPTAVVASGETITNITTQNNIGQVVQNQTNTTQHNNTQNNNVTINVFPTSLHDDYNIKTDHIDLEELKKDLRNKSIFEAVGTSLRKVLENGENLPVKKKNMRSNYSYIHIGNNQWEMRKDKEIYGLISFHISRCIQVYLDGKNVRQLQTYYREATQALEFVAADSIEDLEKEYIKKAKRIMDVLMISAYEREDIDISSMLQKAKTESAEFKSD